MPKNYFISSIVPGADIDLSFAKNVKTFIDHNKSELILIPTQYTVSKLDSIDDEIMSSNEVLKDEKSLNSNLKISSMPINPQNVDPTTGLQRQSQKDASYIFGSAKQRLRLVPNGSNVTLPHALMSTGAMTLPYYKDSKVGRIAYNDHVIGGIVAQVIDNKNYFYTQVQADDDGSFAHMGKMYKGGKVSKADVESIVLGDIHATDIDPKVHKANLEMMDFFKPKFLFLHDVWNGISVNRHEIDKAFSRVVTGELTSIEKEAEITFKILSDYAKSAKKNKSKKVYVVCSNHDLWLDAYLESANYLKDRENFVIAHKMAIAKFEGTPPFEFLMRRLDTKGVLANVEFLDLDSDIRLTKKKIQHAAHGHQGSNGSKGSPKIIEQTYGQSNSGHTHSAEILRGAFIAGTSSKLRLPYNKGGASSWIHSNIITYSYGGRQLLNIIDGKWR